MSAHPEVPVGAGVLCARSGLEPDDWYSGQVRALGAVEWCPPRVVDDDAWVALAASAIADRADGGPVHLLAAGAVVPRALRLAAAHPGLVTSVLAGDPEVDLDDPGLGALLRRVVAPTLVLVAAPRPDSDLVRAQAVAGGIDGGVVVVVDGCVPPLHRHAPESFNEWVTSFTAIAEGLRSLEHHPWEEARA